jgi:macrodomain Ter protein organizer (MatP/YcbG family)
MGIRKRKLIDIDESTFKILSIKAAEKGTNLKDLIEKSLDRLAEDIEESELYAYLVKNVPEGKQIVSSQEKNEFENWLGV